jgi:hypothetical protein
MEGSHRLSLEQMASFLAASSDLEITAPDTAEVRRIVWRIVQTQRYGSLSKSDKGVVRQYLMRVTGYGRAQITRLIAQCRHGEEEVLPAVRRRKFPARYNAADIELLARTDSAHEGLSGAAVRHLLHRGWAVYGDEAYQRLAEISVSHIYNLRARDSYRKHRAVYRSTQASGINIAERRCPDPKGSPGWLRVDTVHQGDPRNGHPGVYHINAVDTVTQWQVVGCVETISERHLIPILTAILHQFPFRIHGFHSDNGSEFINHKVARLLEKLRVNEFTKSRANRTTDNALVEGKNGAIIRKHIGYGHIPAGHAEALQRFYMAHLNPYLNFHRPCGFATVVVNAKGKKRRKYPAEDYATPYERLQKLENWTQYLKPEIRPELLARHANQMSDLESAQRLQKARTQILGQCRAEAAGSGSIPC